MRFEPIRAEDYDQLAPMQYALASSHAAAYPYLFPPVQPQSKKQFLARLRQENFIGIKAVENGVVLGFCCGCVKERRTKRATLHIEDIYVQPDRRRQGIGKQLIEQIKTQAIAAGCRRITLHVWQFNHQAAAFYQKLGFSPLITTEELRLDKK